MDSMGLPAPTNVDPGTANCSILRGMLHHPRWSTAIFAAWTLNCEQTSGNKKCNWNAFNPSLAAVRRRDADRAHAA